MVSGQKQRTKLIKMMCEKKLTSIIQPQPRAPPLILFSKSRKLSSPNQTSIASCQSSISIWKHCYTAKNNSVQIFPTFNQSLQSKEIPLSTKYTFAINQKFIIEFGNPIVQERPENSTLYREACKEYFFLKYHVKNNYNVRRFYLNSIFTKYSFL